MLLICRASALVVLLICLLTACGGSGSSTAHTQLSSATSISQLSSHASSASSVVGSTASSSSAMTTYPGAFALGADLSWASEFEAAGVHFFNKQNEPQDVFVLMKSLGINAIRLRIWVDPAGSFYNGIDDVVAKALRAKAQGQRVMIDFHYSDTWADPGHQTKPAAWAALNITDLTLALANHTRDSLRALRDAGVTPDWVQVGNETNDGFLWDDARPSIEPKATTMKHYADLTSAGYDAVKEIFPSALVVVHLANCHDNANFRWIFDGLRSYGGKFDVIAASAYPTTVTGVAWQTVNDNCLLNLNDMIARYDVPVMIAEVGTPWDFAESKQVVADLLERVVNLPEQKGLGVFYWEPEAYTNDYTLGAFDRSGRPTAVMDAFTEMSLKIHP